MTSWTNATSHRLPYLGLGLILLVVFAAPRPAAAESISVFHNSAYVDTATNFEGESNNVQNTLGDLGHSVSTFAGISASDWDAAFNSSDVVLIPELEVGDLGAALSTSAIDAITNHVSGGKKLIVMGSLHLNYSSRKLLNDVFGYNLIAEQTAATMNDTWSLDTAAAAGTSFDGLAPSLQWLHGTYPLLNNTLPSNATAFYTNANTTALSLFDEGNGYAAYVAWDWFNSDQQDSDDWADALDATITYGSATPVPSPTAAAAGLLSFGLLALHRRRPTRCGA